MYCTSGISYTHGESRIEYSVSTYFHDFSVRGSTRINCTPVLFTGTGTAEFTGFRPGRHDALFSIRSNTVYSNIELLRAPSYSSTINTLTSSLAIAGSTHCADSERWHGGTWHSSTSHCWQWRQHVPASPRTHARCLQILSNTPPGSSSE